MYWPRPVIFEKFNTKEQLEEFLNEKYLGKNINIFASDMVKSRVEGFYPRKIKTKEDLRIYGYSDLNEEEQKKILEKFDYHYGATYHSYILAYNPIIRIEISAETNKYMNITKISTAFFDGIK